MDEFLTEEHYEIAKQNGIPRDRVRQRYWNSGWEVERAITTPIRKRDSSVWHQWKETCATNGIPNPLFCQRLKKGMTPEEAATTPVKRRGPYAKLLDPRRF